MHFQQRNKYSNKKIETQDGKFDSKKEYERWCELKWLEKEKQITDLQRQVRYTLIPTQRDKYGKLLEQKTTYIADFVYWDCATGQTIVEDTKGFRTPEYIIKRKLMLYLKGIRVKEV